jgi:hypothetical protein
MIGQSHKLRSTSVKDRVEVCEFNVESVPTGEARQVRIHSERNTVTATILLGPSRFHTVIHNILAKN